MSALTTSIVLGVSAALANIAGGAIILHKHWDRRYLKYFVALGSGFMLATAIVEMIPQSMEMLRARPLGWFTSEHAGFLILLGYLIVHLFEHTITPHFHFGEETHADEFIQRRKSYSVLIGLMIHTFFDGIAIASGFIVSDWLGWVIFLAVFVHKLPEGFTVASVMLASGSSGRVAWASSFLLGTATLLGVLTMGLTQRAVAVGLPLSAGVTIYVAASDLMPEVNKEPGVKMALVVFLGVGALFLLDHLAHQ
jgi:zinc and cadmium transporter